MMNINIIKLSRKPEINKNKYSYYLLIIVLNIKSVF